jgi:hypothetical protein
MVFTLSRLISVSSRCHEVRCGSPPSVSQFAPAGALTQG